MLLCNEFSLVFKSKARASELGMNWGRCRCVRVLLYVRMNLHMYTWDLTYHIWICIFRLRFKVSPRDMPVLQG